MNQSEVSIVNTNQSKEQVNQPSLSIPVVKPDSVKLNATSPRINEIPATPARFRRQNTAVEKQAEAFTPSEEDSIAFNLKTKVAEQQGIIENTLVKDFLYPLPQTNKQRVGISKEVQLNRPQQREESIVVEGSDSLNVIGNEISKPDIGQRDSADVAEDSMMMSLKDTLLVETIVEPVMEDSVNEIQHIASGRDVLTGLLLFSVALTGFVRIINFKYLQELFSAVLFSQYARKMQKEDSLRNKKAAFTLNFLFLFNTSLFIYQLIVYKNIPTQFGHSLVLIPITMALVFCFGLVKGIAYRFVGFVFENEQDTKEYLFYGSLYDKVFGIIILPIILVVPYIEESVHTILFNTGIIMFILLYLIQLFKGFAIILKNPASLFYMFLYLCALEILPLIVMYNILVK